jgi:hypothetical protein
MDITIAMKRQKKKDVYGSSQRVICCLSPVSHLAVPIYLSSQFFEESGLYKSEIFYYL